MDFKHTQRMLAMAMAATMAIGGALPVRAAGGNVTPTYDEAYYATLDYYGNLTEGSIVKSYILNGATSISDYGTYEETTNLSNGVIPAAANGKTTFDFSGTDAPSHFYFQGKTAEPYAKLPWTLSLSYRLNGVAVPAERLAGQKGVVEIDVDAVPNPKANDYTKNNYTLEAMALFNQDDILSLEAPGAQVQLVGNLRAVLFIALPGEEQHFEIRVGTEDFSFDGMTFLMVPATLGQLDEVAKLSQRKDELEENYNDLSGSLDALLDSLDTVSGSLRSAAGGLDSLNAARGTVSAGKGAVYSRADALRASIDTVSDALAPISDDLDNASAGLTDTKTALGTLNGDVVALREDLDGLKGILGNLRANSPDLSALTGDLNSLQTALGTLRESKGDIDAVLADMTGLQAALTALRAGRGDVTDALESVGRLETSLETLRGNKANLNAVLADMAGLETKLNALRNNKKALDQVINDLNYMEDEFEDLRGVLNRTSLSYHPITIPHSTSTLLTNNAARATTIAGKYEDTVKNDEDGKVGVPEFIKAALEMVGKDSQIESAQTAATGILTAMSTGSVDLPTAVQAVITQSISAAAAAGGTLDDDTKQKITDSITNVGKLIGAYYRAAGAGADTMTLQQFMYGLVLASGESDAPEADADSLYELYTLSQNGTLSSVQSDLGNTQTQINKVNSTISDVTTLLKELDEPTRNLLDALRYLCADMDALHKLVTDGDALVAALGALSADAGKLNTLLDGSDALLGSLGDMSVKLAALDGTVDDADALLSSLGGLSEDIAGLDTLLDGGDTLLGVLGQVSGDIAALPAQALLDSADDLAALGQGGTDKLSAVLGDVDSLYTVLDTCEPMAQQALETVGGVITASRRTVTDANAFAAALEGLMQSSGTQLDYATQQSLSGLAASLRDVAGSLDATAGIRAAKDVVTDIIEDTWTDYTGDINNLLLMDATAEPVSLTDSRNGAPESVQIMIRTQEIKADSAAGGLTVKTQSTAKEHTTFWQRVGQIFKDVWAAIIGLVRH